MRTLILAILGALSLSATPCQEEGLVIKRLKLVDPDFDDLVHLLKIRKVSGEFDVRGPFDKISLALEVYKKGVKQEKTIQGSSLRAEKGEARQGRFTLQIADLEHLRLGHAKGQFRAYFAMKEGATETSVDSDFAKDWFDAGAILGSGSFKPKVEGKNRVALFWHAAGPAGAIAFGATPKDVVEKNPDLDILIGYLIAE